MDILLYEPCPKLGNIHGRFKIPYFWSAEFTVDFCVMLMLVLFAIHRGASFEKEQSYLSPFSF